MPQGSVAALLGQTLWKAFAKQPHPTPTGHRAGKQGVLRYSQPSSLYQDFKPAQVPWLLPPPSPKPLPQPSLPRPARKGKCCTCNWQIVQLFTKLNMFSNQSWF